MKKTPRLNADWHRLNRMPAKATEAQRIAWHRSHRDHCACRPIPEKLLALMRAQNLL